MKKIILNRGLALLFISCSDFLDLKPDKKMVVPELLEDCELLLNDYSTMNSGFPSLGEVASDNYYLTTASWQAISTLDERNTYVWNDALMTTATSWQTTYKVIYQSNQVLETLSGINIDMGERLKYNELKGAAYFFRGFAFHQLLGIYTLPYEQGKASSTLGIPLRLKPDLDNAVQRASLKDSYQQVLSDYQSAIDLLPAKGLLKGRPYKEAAFGGMARIYLEMNEYEKAYRYADSALQLNSELLDYNSLNSAVALPVQRFNREVLFQAITGNSSVLVQGAAKIDSVLYRSYDQNDLRKKILFKPNTGTSAGTYAFKGSYNNTAAGLFVGLTTAEMYLIRAETAVRTGKVTQALLDLNFLMKNRWTKDLYIDFNATDEAVILQKILMERRKELVFRGIRWSDLKRLNAEGKFPTALKRVIDGQEYELEPGSLKYALLIPQDVIELGNLEQNKR
jgi:tetratricopeptide (TPR) repeat protein